MPKQVVFSNRAFTALLAETKEKIKTETGGIFLGVMHDDVWYVIESIDPGPKSIFQPAYFEYDGNYVRHLANKTNRFYNDRLDVLGLWHRHPGSMDTFSSTDDGTIKQFTKYNDGITISALVNIDMKFRLTMYEATCASNISVPSYKKIDYKVGDDKIPKNILEITSYKDIEKQINEMFSKKSCPKSSQESQRSITAFYDSLAKYLKKLTSYKLKNGIELENSRKRRDDIIDLLIDECLFCEEKHIPFTCNPTDNNEVEFIVGAENFKFLFYIIDSSQKENYFEKRKGLFSRSKDISDVEATEGEYLCFIYEEHLHLYNGNLIKKAWEEQKK